MRQHKRLFPGLPLLLKILSAWGRRWRKTLEEGKGRLLVGRRKRRTICLRYCFPRAFTSCHIHLCGGFTKRTFTWGVKKMFKFWTLRLKCHKAFPFMLSKANVNIFRRRGPLLFCSVNQWRGSLGGAGHIFAWTWEQSRPVCRTTQMRKPGE